MAERHQLQRGATRRTRRRRLDAERSQLQRDQLQRGARGLTPNVIKSKAAISA